MCTDCGQMTFSSTIQFILHFLPVSYQKVACFYFWQNAVLLKQQEDHRGTLKLPTEADINPIERNWDKIYKNIIKNRRNKTEAKI